MKKKPHGKKNTTHTIARPPIIAVMGHIDHGKSTLLDYIRKSKVAEQEAGGITQHLSAYEVVHPASDGEERHLTFLDTPGHEAFQAMRMRGSRAADIAILVVSAEDGVMPQTKEALAAIRDAGIPFIVAINKIDKPGADVERTKHSLLEEGVYLEGLGGEVPYVPLSAKTGEGVPELLDLLLLVAELQELRADLAAPPAGMVIEAHHDPKRGISATVIVTDGTLRKKGFMVAGGAWAPLRIVEDFLGKSVGEAIPSSPVTVVGFSSIPEVGAPFCVVETKKEAQERAARPRTTAPAAEKERAAEEEGAAVIPLVLKADTRGTLEALHHELAKHESGRAHLKVLIADIGTISEGDIKAAAAFPRALVAGFNVKTDPAARALAERTGVEIGTFSVIYDLSDWLAQAIAARIPRRKVRTRTGHARIIKIFSTTKGGQVVGGRVTEGEIVRGAHISILRRGARIAEGQITSLQSGKTPVEKVSEGSEFGALITSKHPLAAGDEMETFVEVEE